MIKNWFGSPILFMSNEWTVRVAPNDCLKKFGYFQSSCLLATYLLLISTLLFSDSVFSTELYRYQDGKGNWVFGDRKSLGNNQKIKGKAEKISLAQRKIIKIRPELFLLNNDFKEDALIQSWQLTNPLPVHIQHLLRVKGQKTFFASVVAEPLQERLLDSSEYNGVSSTDQIEHFYLLGEQMERPSMQNIPLPYLNNRKFRISQGFNGTYSHTGRGNTFAIDIAMPIGESVTAVREGVVADARDDFSIGGAAKYFLDKANQVTIVHDDGSYAIYAHILHGSLAVSIGDTVKVGQTLARVGNTGFSTGPHLHFVMRYNSGAGVYSIPFKFKTSQGFHVPEEGKSYLFKSSE